MAIRARDVEVIIDDTAEAGGPGDGFRPSELLLGALGSCMMGTLITFARNTGIELEDLVMTLEDETAEHPERITGITMRMSLATDADDRRIRTLERVAAACKIHRTLTHRPELELEFDHRPIA
jgi:putative redox protein